MLLPLGLQMHSSSLAEVDFQLFSFFETTCEQVLIKQLSPHTDTAVNKSAPSSN